MSLASTYSRLILTKVNTHHNRPLRRPFREDPPPPPPPSFAGFIEDFPKPRNFDELIIMNMMLGALFGWMLKKLIGYFLSRQASQRTKNVSSFLLKRATRSIPIAPGDRSRPIPSRSRLPEERQSPLPLGRQRPKHPLSVFLTFTLAGSGTLVLFRLRARRRALNVEQSHNMPVVPLAVFRSCDSTLHTPHLTNSSLDSPADTSYPDRLPRPKTTHTLCRRQPSITRRSPSAVRLSKTEQVKYFYQDEIIGFESGPRPRGVAQVPKESSGSFWS